MSENNCRRVEPREELEGRREDLEDIEIVVLGVRVKRTRALTRVSRERRSSEAEVRAEEVLQHSRSS